MRPSAPLSLPLVLRPGVRPWRLALGRLSPDLIARRYSARILSGPPQQVKTLADLLSYPDTPGELRVEVCGWVRSVRKSRHLTFADITDGSSMRPVQVTADQRTRGKALKPGASVRIKGTWTPKSQPPAATEDGAPSIVEASQADKTEPDVSESVASEIKLHPEIHASVVEVFGETDQQTYPMQNKYHTPETLRNYPHLRGRTPVNSTMLRLRSDAIALLTQFFFREQFQQTHPPIITSSDCEGAGEAFSVSAEGQKTFFKTQKYLTVSSQLHLEALAQSLGNVWTLSPTFRAEKSDTSRHLSEFYMLEAEMSFVQDMDQVMDLIQRMLGALTAGLKQLRAARELDENRLDSKEPAERDAFEDLVDREELLRRWRGLMTPIKWPRITYTEAIQRLRLVADQFEHEPVWGAGLQSEHEMYLARTVGHDDTINALLPVFVTHYPRAIKAFYMLKSPPSSSLLPDSTVDCFDLIVPDLGELAGGSMREHRLEELVENMKLHGLEVPTKNKKEGRQLDWYLDLRRWGTTPHGGFGLGFDRLLSYLTGVNSLREVVPFPRHHGRCDC